MTWYIFQTRQTLVLGTSSLMSQAVLTLGATSSMAISSTLYVIDYGYNSLYAVDTTTGAPTIGPSPPYGGETWTGLTGAQMVPCTLHQRISRALRYTPLISGLDSSHYRRDHQCPCYYRYCDQCFGRYVWCRYRQ